MWPSVLLVAVALCLAAAWWVASGSVAAQAAARSGAGDGVRGGARGGGRFRGGGKGSAFSPYVPQKRASSDAAEQEGAEQQRIGRVGRMPPRPQPRPALQPQRRLSGQQEMLRQLYEQLMQTDGTAAAARKGVESPSARDAQRGVAEEKKRTEKGAEEADEDDDGVLGRRIVKRPAFQQKPLPQRGIPHRTPPPPAPAGAGAAPAFGASTPHTAAKKGPAPPGGTPSTAMRTGHHSTTADVVRLYSSPSKFTGRGTNNTQLVTFFADQEQSLAVPSALSGTPLRVLPHGRRFEATASRKLPEPSGQDEWAAANQRIKQEYDELANHFTAALTSALDAAAQAPREIVLGYMKEEEIKAAKAAAEAQRRREVALAKLTSALAAPQPGLAELQEAIREAEDADVGDAPEAKQAISLVHAATKVCELLTTAVQEGDTARLAQICQSISADERFRKLVNARNDRLQRLFNNANKLIEEEQEQRARRQLEEQKRAEPGPQQRPPARFGGAAESPEPAEQDEGTPAFVAEAMRLFTDLELWTQRTAHVKPDPAIARAVEQCCAEVEKIAFVERASTSDSPKAAVIAVTTAVERTLHESNKGGADALLYATMQIFRTVLQVASTVDTLEKAVGASGIQRLYDLAHVVYSVCRVVKRGNRVFRAMCLHACPPCVPMTSSQANTFAKLDSIPTLSVSAGVGLMSAAIAHGGYEAFTTDDGWRWLIRFAHFAQEDASQLDAPAEALCVFIHLCGKEVARRAGVVHFDTAMEALRAMVVSQLSGPAVARLRSLLDKYLSPQTKRELPSRQLGPMSEPHILVSATLVESLRFFEEIAASANTPDLKTVKSSVQKQVRTAGNILTWDKLDLALNKVFTAVDEVRRLGDDRLVKFALTYIANMVASRSEIEQYSADSAPLLAAFLSQIGQALPDVPDLVRAKLYDICPETVPHFWPASSVAEFIVKLKQQRPKVFEDAIGVETNVNTAYDLYLQRVERYMWTFAALCLPHRSLTGVIEPMLSVDDAWRWLALTINACEREAPYHLAGVLEPFLKVAAEQLDAEFTDRASGVHHFRNLLETIRDQVVPKLDDDLDLNHTNKARLLAILNKFVA